MLQITINRNRNENRITGYTAKGHCGYAECGKDIVCAGASTLLQLPFMGFDIHEKEAIEYFEVAINKGDLEVKIPAEYPQVIIETIVAGLKEIEQQYPEYVRIEEIIQ